MPIFSQLPNDIIMRIIQEATAHDIHKQKFQGTLNILLIKGNDAREEIECGEAEHLGYFDFSDVFLHGFLGLVKVGDVR